jgi:hypothetical protein
MSLLTEFFIFVFIYSAVLSAQDCRATISLQTNNKNSALFIDDKFFAKGENIVIELDTGNYKIRIIEDLKKWNAEIISDTLRIVDCNKVSLNCNFKNKTIIDSNPQDVYVNNGDSLLGFTPILVDKNFVELYLSKPGYSNKIVSTEEVNSGNKPELTFLGEVKDESFYNTTLFKVLVGTAIALGATTAYYKLEADKKFDEYQVTGDPGLLDQTDRYDIVSGISFVALQINVGLIIYFFLSD